MGARHMVSNSHACEERAQGLILPSPIGLDSTNFTIKLTLNRRLEITKTRKHLGLLSKQVNPCELAKIINEANIIFITAY
jgi:hypothetical protein